MTSRSMSVDNVVGFVGICEFVVVAVSDEFEFVANNDVIVEVWSGHNSYAEFFCLCGNDVKFYWFF